MGSPDVLMIEAAPGAKQIEQAKWRGGALDDGQVDALPYIDHDYADPKVKAEVDKLIAEEMRLSTKKPADFLAELPPVPSINSQVNLRASQCPSYFPRSTTRIFTKQDNSISLIIFPSVPLP
jgi:hypothetical protein